MYNLSRAMSVIIKLRTYVVVLLWLLYILVHVHIFPKKDVFSSIYMIYLLYYHNRDRAPFVLTPDMAYVINGGDTPTTSFQKFTDLCCAAYNELRRNCNLFINLLELVSHCVFH